MVGCLEGVLVVGDLEVEGSVGLGLAAENINFLRTDLIILRSTPLLRAGSTSCF